MLIQNLAPIDAGDGNTFARRRKLSLAFVGIGILALLLFGGLTTPGFLTLDNLLVIVRAASITGIVAVGMSYITISGNLFALSAEELAVLAACIFAYFMGAGFDVVSSVMITLVAAVVFGSIQGVVISRGADPIITSLAFGALFQGLASVVSGNKQMLLGSNAAEWLGTGRPLGIPMQSWAFVILALIGWVVLKKTRYGRKILLMGANKNTAQATGLNRTLVVIVAMSVFGLCCALVGISGAAQFSRATATMFPGLNIDVVAAILVGGIALQGGRGSPLQAAFGAVFIALLQNYMLLHAFTSGQRMMVIGALVVASTLGYHYLQGKR
ncbi:ABC transporter permease [Shinella daejeonensis]|uniref:ABC transporter permease n=1 Tax=Shinella daejeonensis TaxID=659017 RepID=UPI0020C821B3|nr:ABC transporter permease [Shinella daejeonensis]MCP8894572.1 ABC transporter permease [Shinella daejeonensis]